MDKYEFYLESHNLTAIDNPQEVDIANVLEALHPNHNAYVILSRSDGSYLQTAGSKTNLTVEWREAKNTSFIHWVLGKGEIQEQTTLVHCDVGPITVRVNELLSLNDAKNAFFMFLAKGKVPKDFTLRDNTQLFMDD